MSETSTTPDPDGQERLGIEKYLRYITASRFPGIRDVARWFSYEHLPERLPRYVSESCTRLAADVIEELPDSPELTAGLRKLLEAKDCFVRAAIAAQSDGSCANEGSTVTDAEEIAGSNS